MSDLDKLRKRIDALDAELLKTLAERMEIVDELGVHKKARDLELRDDERFRQLLADRMDQAAKLGLSAEFTAKLYNLIHETALEREAGA